jgi:hypothetical protein
MINQVVDRMIHSIFPDTARINRCLKVYHYAMSIAEAEGCEGDSYVAVCLSAILRGIIDGPEPSIAQKILSDLDFPQSAKDRAIYLIENRQADEKTDSLDSQILIESDYLVKFKDEGMSPSSIRSIKKEVFKTESGKRFCSLLNA